MSEGTKELTIEERFAILEKTITDERAKNAKLEAKLKAKKGKKEPVVEEPAIDAEHIVEEVEEVHQTKAIQKVDPELSTAVTVTDVGKELATIVQNAITPAVQWAKDNPGTAVAVIGGGTTAALAVAHAAGLSTFSPFKVIENAFEGFKKLGQDQQKKQLPNSPSEAAQLQSVADLEGPVCSQEDMREALLEQRELKFGSNGDMIPIEEYHLIDRKNYKVSNVIAYYLDNKGMKHRIVIGHKTAPR